MRSHGDVAHSDRLPMGTRATVRTQLIALAAWSSAMMKMMFGRVGVAAAIAGCCEACELPKGAPAWRVSLCCCQRPSSCGRICMLPYSAPQAFRLDESELEQRKGRPLSRSLRGCQGSAQARHGHNVSGDPHCLIGTVADFRLGETNQLRVGPGAGIDGDGDQRVASWNCLTLQAMTNVHVHPKSRLNWARNIPM